MRILYKYFISSDTNECLLPRSDPMADKCHSEATCSNTIGGYNCQCNPGFTGNGTHCQGKLLQSPELGIQLKRGLDGAVHDA